MEILENNKTVLVKGNVIGFEKSTLEPSKYLVQFPDLTTASLSVDMIEDEPQAVKDRADYFWEMAEDGLTFMGAMECIFSDKKPEDYDFWATKDWLPKSKEFNDWVGYSLGMSQLVIAVYLIYGGG